MVRDGIATDPDLPDANRIVLLRSLDVLLSGYRLRAADQAAQPIPTPPIRTGDKKPLDDDKRLAFESAKKEQNRVKGALDSQKELKAQREGNYLRVQDDVDRTSIPQVEDIKYPANWKELTAKRQGLNLTMEERKIMEALAKPLNVEMPDSTLEAVIDYIKDKTGVTIIVPQSVLDDKAITYKTPLSVNLKNVSMRTILKKALADVGLVYIVKDNVIQVTTEEIAAKTLTTRTYYMGDLLNLTDLHMPAYARQAEAARMIQDVIGVIVGTVEPNSWWVNGGPGRIVFDPRSMSLVVTQTAEVHYMMNFKR